LVKGLHGKDILRGGPGNDKMYGHKQNDILIAGPGDDILRGNANNDELFGGLGLNTLIGGRGKDICHGDANDIYINCETIHDDHFGPNGEVLPHPV